MIPIFWGEMGIKKLMRNSFNNALKVGVENTRGEEDEFLFKNVYINIEMLKIGITIGNLIRSLNQEKRVFITFKKNQIRNKLYKR